MLKPIALRLQPGQDLKVELDTLAQSRNIEAACILTCAGSLTKAVLRYANQEKADFPRFNWHNTCRYTCGTPGRQCLDWLPTDRKNECG